MKRFSMVILLCITALSLHSQQISRFLDFRLGQSIAEVRNIIASKFSSTEWNGNVCKIYNVTLANESFNQLTIEFSGGQLARATFLNSPPAIITSSSYEYNQKMQSQASFQQQRIGRLYSQYRAKYGKETMATDSSVIWTDLYGNSINLYITINNHDSDGLFVGNINVVITYSLQQSDF